MLAASGGGRLRGFQRFLLLFVQHGLDVPGQQRLALLDGGGSRQMFISARCRSEDPEAGPAISVPVSFEKLA